ncbi:hypothetical protein BDZ85DRAFT_247382 [Elsinoe ampelina]|uniref:Uncharacterized protein n=1 Tax=Elsinoe ampelina TaxID=302913 RepID=A0A6A6GMU4_9PEZI|nr:hypothetical protein BDZ85DRAFT_247382 [Elsinoe ampelina]
MAALSQNDSRVLGALFDPESSPSGAAQINHEVEDLPGISAEDCKLLKNESAAILKPLNVPEPSPEQISTAHTAMTSLIQRHPDYAPAYIDRAQIKRMSLPMTDLFTQPSSEASQSLLRDLQKGIDLASPPSPQAPVSGLQSRLLASAHTHRGLLLLRVADMRKQGLPVFGVGESITKMEAQDIEGLASRDFYQGGRYGNKIAQQLSVKTNPYAKMCGAIVKEAIQKEIDEAEGRVVMDLRALS